MPRWLQFLIFVSIMTAVYGGAHFYVYWRFVSAFHPQGAALWGARLAAIALALSFPLARLASSQLPSRVTELLDWGAAVWMGVFVYLLLGTVLVHVVSALTGLAAGETARAAVLRWGQLAAAVAALVVAGWGMHVARHPGVTELEVPVAKLPKALDGFTVAHLSDVHIGTIVGPERLRRIVERVNALSPDLVVITGDLVDEDEAHLEDVAHELANLKARHGVLAVTGNHEFYAGADETVRRSSEHGVRWLRNDKATVAGALVVYGVDDFAASMTGRPVPPLDRVIDAEARVKPALLLQHRPVNLEQAAALGIDLMLSGHVHRGQLWPFGYIAKRIFPRDAGLFRVDRASLYVSRGVGTWGPPMRVGSPPEIVKLRLRAAP